MVQGDKEFIEEIIKKDPGWRRFVEWEAEVVKCTLCKHYHLPDYKVCDVYPKGIPNTIFFRSGCEKFAPRDNGEEDEQGDTGHLCRRV